MKAVRFMWFITGLLGLLVGSLMLLRPDGSALSLELSALERTPVHDYALPGVFVGVLYGIIPLLFSVFYRQKNKYWQIAALFYLCASTIWIVTEYIMWGLFDWAHILFMTLNSLTLVLLVRWLYIPWQDRQK